MFDGLLFLLQNGLTNSLLSFLLALLVEAGLVYH